MGFVRLRIAPEVKMSNTTRHPLAANAANIAELREHIAGYEQKIAYGELIGLDQSDRRTVLVDLLTELGDRLWWNCA
jgi:hypothetical protein